MGWEDYLNEQLRAYQHKDLCKRQIIPAVTVYKDLRPSKQNFVHNDGRQTDLFTLEGTIPVNFRGSTYNIPVCIFLQERHPFIPPIVYVRPTSTMAIKVSKHVDNTGRVFLPYLSEWAHPKSDLAALIQILCCIFAEEPPVFARQAGYTQQPQAGYQPQYGYSTATSSYQTPTTGYPPSTTGYPPTTSGYPPTTSSTPPYPSQPHRMPIPMPMPGGRQSSPYQQSYPPTTASSQYPPRQSMPQFPSPGGYQPVSQAPPTSHSSPVTNQQLVTNQQNSVTISDDTIKASLLSAVEGKLKRRIKPSIDQAQMELDQLNKTQQDLKNGRTKLEDMIKRLEQEQADVESNINVLTTKNEEISDVINKLQSDSEHLNIDEAVITTAPLYNQILNLFAEENAVEDTIYYLSESLRKESIDLDVFLKNVRSLSRKQFMLRALLYKARKTAGLSDMAAL